MGARLGSGFTGIRMTKKVRTFLAVSSLRDEQRGKEKTT